MLLWGDDRQVLGELATMLHTCINYGCLVIRNNYSQFIDIAVPDMKKTMI